MIVKVWVRLRHYDYEIFEVNVNHTNSFTQYIKDLYVTGGFHYENNFVPWHRINFIEEVK